MSNKQRRRGGPKQRGTWLKNMSNDLRLPMSALIVLSPDNDPFNVETVGRKEEAEWFAELYRRFGFGLGTHIRRVHYRIISQEVPVLMVDGRPYENTQQCWEALCDGCRDARYLGFVNINDIVDRRNRDTTVNLKDIEGRPASLNIGDTDIIEMPPLPELCFTAPKIPQRYHLEVICEKSTIDDILSPLGEKYEINVTPCVGEISATRCHELVKRVKASGRPTRILYLSDFDPGGQSMPVACARKIEFFLSSTLGILRRVA